jgi:hypothetical protein
MSRNPTNAVRPVGYASCALYTPGHQVHFIQMRRASETDPANYRNGTLVSVDDDGWITVEVDGEALRFWTHDPARARECFEESGGHVGLREHGVLDAPCADGGGRYYICVATDGPTPCVPSSPVELTPAGLVARIRTHGGLMIPSEILRGAFDNDGRGGPPERLRC